MRIGDLHTYTTYYFDNAGQGLSVVTTDDAPDADPAPHFWATQVVRNSTGEVSEIHTPENVNGYTHADGTFTSQAGAGLVLKLDYLSENGVMDGFLRSVRHQKGTGASVDSYFDKYLTYFAETNTTDARQTVGDASYVIVRPLVNGSLRFPDPVTDWHSSTLNTTSGFTFDSTHPLVIATASTTYPAISAANNGENLAYYTASAFSLDGTAVFTRSRSGRINFYEYDVNTGRLVKFIQDADTSITADFDGADIPDGFGSTGNPLHRVYDYGYDAQGRRVSTNNPVGREERNYYGVLASGQPFVFQIPRVDSSSTLTYTGPATAAVLNNDGRLLARFTLGLASSATSDPNHATLFQTTADPASWLNTAQTDVFAAIQGRATGMRIGDLHTYTYSPNARELLTHRLYFGIPTSGEGAAHTNYDLTSLAYDAAGRLATITDPTETIDKFEYDALGRPVRRSRGTDNSGSSTDNMLAVGEYHWDGGDPTEIHDKANSRLTEYDAIMSATSERATKFYYDEEGNVIGILNPAAPHAVFKYNNVGQVTATALLGGTGFAEEEGIPDPLQTTLSTRRALVENFYDEVGQRYRRRTYRINQTTGDYYTSLAAESIEENTWYCPEGCVDCEQGTSTTKTEHNRACQVTADYTLVSTEPQEGGPSYADMTSVLSTDTVLHEDHYFYNDAGDYVGHCSADRTADSCADGGGGALITGFDFSDGFSQTPNTGVPHRWDLGMIWLDPLERPFWGTDYGDPRYGCSGTIDSGAPSDFNNPCNPKSWHQTYDNLGRTYEQVHSAGLIDAEHSSQPVDGNRFGYDDAGRPTDRWPLAGDGIAYEDCHDKPGALHSEYTDGYKTLEQALIPGTSGYEPGPPTKYFYPRQMPEPSGIYPSSGPFLPPDIHDNTLMLCQAGPGAGSIDPQSLSMPHADTTFFTYDRQGEMTGWMDPAGYRTTHSLDPLGRPSDRTIDPPLGTYDPAQFNQSVHRTHFDYDDLSRPSTITQFDGSNTQLGQVAFEHDDWGHLSSLSQDFGADFPHSSGPTVPLSTAFSNSHFDNRSVGGWQGIRTDDITFPSGQHLRNTFGGDCSTGLDIDQLIGRVSRVNSITGSGSSEISTPIVNQSYLGIVFPSQFGLPGRGTTDPDAWHQLLTPDGVYLEDPSTSGVTPVQDAYGRLNHDFWCAGGSSCTPSTGSKLYDVSLTFDPADRITNATDLTVHSASSNYAYGNACIESLHLGSAMGEEQGNYPGGSGGSLLSGPTKRSEQWTFDSVHNVTDYRVDNDYETGTGTEFDSTDIKTAATFTDANRTSSAHQFTGGSSSDTPPSFDEGTVSLSGAFDDNGNQTYIPRRELWYRPDPLNNDDPTLDHVDGRYFRYDVEGHLIDAWHEASGGGKGVPWAHFTYDGLGRLASAVYHDTVAAGDDTKSADEIFGGETVEFYIYDQHWRVTSVWRAGPKVGGTRPDAYCYERFTYASAGLNGRGDAWLLDCPVMSEICTSGDGVTFDRVRRFLQNARGDVVGVQEAAPHTPDLSVRYSVYGFPEVVFDRDPYHTADFNGDGDVGTNADITAFFQCLANNCCPTCDSIDVNRDGSFGTDADIDAFFAVISGETVAPQADLKDLRFGFRGYWWDDHLKLYHVRHRVYDPASFRWLQPDPAGYVDGLNLYAYCGGDPINFIDPSGLSLASDVSTAWTDYWGNFKDGYHEGKDVVTGKAAKDDADWKAKASADQQNRDDALARLKCKGKSGVLSQEEWNKRLNDDLYQIGQTRKGEKEDIDAAVNIAMFSTGIASVAVGAAERLAAEIAIREMEELLAKEAAESAAAEEIGEAAFEATESVSQDVAEQGGTTVYRSFNEAGQVNYVGITDDLERRAAEQLRERGIEIFPIDGLQNLAREDARAVEQALIEYYGLGKNGGTLLNKINSIARSNPIYEGAMARARDILRSIGHPGPW